MSSRGLLLMHTKLNKLTRLWDFSDFREMSQEEGRAAPSPRAVHWMFVINNPTDNDEEKVKLLAEYCTGLVYQLERGEEGTEHIQGYCALEKRMRRSELSKRLPRAYLDVARSPKDAIVYCQKEDTRVRGPYVFGDLSAKRQGKRSDLEQLHNTLRSGKFTEETLVEDHFAVMLKYAGNVRQLASHFIPDRTERTRLHIFYGPPNSGKTYAAMRFHPDPPDDVYTLDGPPLPHVFKLGVSRSDPWFDGYDPLKHKVVVFDEYQGQIPHERFLQLADEYATTVEIKGGTLKFRPTDIILTMNNPPYLLYKKTWAKSRDSYNAFWRRVTTLTKMITRDDWKQRDLPEWHENAYIKCVAHAQSEQRALVRPIIHRPVSPPQRKQQKKRRAPTPELDKRQRRMEDYQ